MMLAPSRVARALIGLAPLLVACNGGDDAVETDTDAPPGLVLEEVMRDCQPEAGRICPWAGAGYNGWNGDEVHRLDAFFSYPMGIAWPRQGRPVLVDWNNHKLRAVNDAEEDGFETVMGTDFLGDGDPGLTDQTPGGAPGTTVALNHPTQHTFLSDGTLLSASWHTHKFRTWDPDSGQVHVVFGSRPGFALDQAGTTPEIPNQADDDGDGRVDEPGEFGQPAATTLMNQPKELFVDPNDEDLVYYVDMRNERIRLWNRGTGTVDTVAGETVDGADADTTPGSKGYCGEGPALETCFAFPKNANPEPGGAIALNADSSVLFVADSENHAIRAIDLAAGTISLLSGTPGVAGFRDGPADQAQWSYPSDFAYDADTNELFVADTNNHRIRAIDLGTMEVRTVAGNGEPTCPLVDLTTPATCSEQHHGGDGGPATDATLYRPFGVDLDPEGDLVVADTYDHRFRVVYR